MGPVSETIALEPFADKWRDFGWDVRRCDGHDHDVLLDALQPAVCEQPVVLIADTVKGKGVSFMENQVLWHYRSPQGEELTRALVEVEAAL